MTDLGIRRRPSTFTCLALASATALAGLAAAPAAAAPPANDSIGDARVIGDVPARIVQDTSQATPARGDGRCVRGASVWYRLRPSETRRLRFATVGSGFDTVLAVFTGPRADRRLVGCSDDTLGLASAVEVGVTAGRNYWVAVSACCTKQAAGGRGVLRVYRPRPAGITARITSLAAGTVSGRLIASGTYRCATPSIAYVRLNVSQRLGKRVARGGGGRELATCDGKLRRWNVRVDSRTGWAFRSGRASVTLRRGTFDGFDLRESAGTSTRRVGTTAQRVGGR